MDNVINVFIGKKIRVDDYASTRQMQYLKSLCAERDVEFPFASMHKAKSCLCRIEVSRIIKQLLSGYRIVFIFPDIAE